MGGAKRFRLSYYCESRRYRPRSSALPIRCRACWALWASATPASGFLRRSKSRVGDGTTGSLALFVCEDRAWSCTSSFRSPGCGGGSSSRRVLQPRMGYSRPEYRRTLEFPSFEPRKVWFSELSMTSRLRTSSRDYCEWAEHRLNTRLAANTLASVFVEEVLLTTRGGRG